MSHTLKAMNVEGSPRLSIEQTEVTHADAKSEKPWYRRWWVIALGVFLIVGFIGSFFSDADEEAEETAEAQESEEQDVDDTGTSEEEEASEEDEEAAEEEEPEVADYEIRLDEDWDEAWIEFELQDHFTAGLMASQAQNTAREGLQEAYQEYPDAGRYVVMIERDGATQANAGFDPDTMAELDFDDRTLNVFEHLDAGSAHPGLLD